MISELLSKALMIILVGMGVVFFFILLMIMAINLNARIIKALGKDKEQTK
jgi:Na+-transporting methylmalonyl-CoA/oxaloacetate decarboxylase gamma subunit